MSSKRHAKLPNTVLNISKRSSEVLIAFYVPNLFVPANLDSCVCLFEHVCMFEIIYQPTTLQGEEGGSPLHLVQFVSSCKLFWPSTPSLFAHFRTLSVSKVEEDQRQHQVKEDQKTE